MRRASHLGQRRLALLAPARAQYERETPEPGRRLRRPLRAPSRGRRAGATRGGRAPGGALVGLDCFYVGRLSGTKGAVGQYTAIDVASGFAWAELHASPHNPRAEPRSALVRRVARELARAGWRLEAGLTDNGSEFHAGSFVDTLAALGVEQRRIRAGRPQTNGYVERLQQTILEEFWRASLHLGVRAA